MNLDLYGVDKMFGLLKIGSALYYPQEKRGSLRICARFLLHKVM